MSVSLCGAEHKSSANARVTEYHDLFVGYASKACRVIVACPGRLGRKDILADEHGAAARDARVCSCLYDSVSLGIGGVMCPICQGCCSPFVSQGGIGLGGYGVFRCAHYMHQEYCRGPLHVQFGLILCPICGAENEGFVCVFDSTNE
jgi:hypothetical protein